MNLSFEKRFDNCVIYLEGELDEHSARMIRDDVDKFIESERLRSLTLDMAGVSFVDSTGLGFVLGRYKKMREKHAELLLASVPAHVDKVFRASGVYNFVPKV